MAAAAVAASSGSSNSITVAVAYPAPPAALLDQFTKQTGIKVNWVNIGWDDLQTKIAAAMTANTYFADVADVDWSKVGEYQKTGWFDPLNKYFNVASLSADMPQLNTFVSNNELMGVPFDSSFLVTTVNAKDFAKAGITTMPTTLAGFTAALQKVGKANGIASPLDIQFATAEGLSTCWYQMTAAFGGQVLTAQDTPAFTSPSSPGYQAMTWMVNAYKSGLVPKANINTTDYQGFTTEEAKNRTAAALCDYSGSVASIYNVPSSSSVVNETEYIPTPGATGVGLNVANPDGIGIPKTAKNVAGAVKFINWFTEHREPGDLGRAEGPEGRGEHVPAARPAVQLQLDGQGRATSRKPPSSRPSSRRTRRRRSRTGRRPGTCSSARRCRPTSMRQPPGRRPSRRPSAR